MKKNMQAAVINQFGGIDTIRMQTVPIPDVGPDEMLIRLESAGVGAWDPFEREGGVAQLFGLDPGFPYTLGSEGAGVVEALGSEVKKFKPGDRVYALNLINPKGGFYAEYIVIPHHNVSLIPDKLTTEQAGVMPVDAMTALSGLEKTLQIKPDESLLILGATGGIGHLAIQFAKRMGARLLAVASGDDGVELARQLGADTAINGRRDDITAAARTFAPDGLDAVLLTTGGEAAEKALDAVRDGGRAAYPNGVDPIPQNRPGLSVNSYDGEFDLSMIDKLNHLIESGPFVVKVAKTFPLEQAAEAHRFLGNHFLGKIALRPG